MSHNILRKGNFGEYDYQIRCFEINNEILNIPLSRAQDIIDCAGSCTLNSREMNFIKTYIHEANHFIDSNASLWGGQFTYHLIKSCINSEASEVLKNSTCELLFHSNYRFFMSDVMIDRLSMRYCLVYDSRLGITPIFLYYNEFGEPLNSSPVSILSLFEARSFLSETIFEYEHYQKNNDHVMQYKCQSVFLNIIKSSQDLEYTSFIRFAFQVWEGENFLDILKSLKYILGFSLNIPDSCLASVPLSLIEEVFYACDDRYISSLKMEFSRGEARPAFSLMMIVFFMSNLRSTKKFKINEISLFIEDLFNNFCMEFDLINHFSNLQRQVQSECFNDISGDEVVQSFENLSEELLHDKLNIFNMPMIECIYGNDTIKPLIPIKINFQEYQNKNIDLIGKIDFNQIENSKRQHLSPNQYHQWLNEIVNIKNPNKAIWFKE